jgi:hypothetical protein
MLADRRRLVERAAAALKRLCADDLTEYGDFIARLLPSDWFVTITFRDTRPNSPPQSKPIGPFRRRAIARLRSFMEEMESEAGQPIGWIFVEGFGDNGGRLHLHGLIAGVVDLDRKTWRHVAFRRFGRTTVCSYRPHRGADHYVAKHLMKGGDVHYGGQLLLKKLAEVPRLSPVTPGKVVVAHSADAPSRMFKNTLGRRRKR